MKKNYMKPTMTVETIMFRTHLLSGSDPQAGINPSGSVNAADVESRYNDSFWDDEE